MSPKTRKHLETDNLIRREWPILLYALFVIISVCVYILNELIINSVIIHLVIRTMVSIITLIIGGRIIQKFGTQGNNNKTIFYALIGLGLITLGRLFNLLLTLLEQESMGQTIDQWGITLGSVFALFSIYYLWKLFPINLNKTKKVVIIISGTILVLITIMAVQIKIQSNPDNVEMLKLLEIILRSILSFFLFIIMLNLVGGKMATVWILIISGILLGITDDFYRIIFSIPLFQPHIIEILDTIAMGIIGIGFNQYIKSMEIFKK